MTYMSEYQDEEFDKKSFEEEAKAISQSVLEKHLVARKFDENNTKKWGDLIIDEIHKTLSDKYPQHGYLIFFYMSNKTPFLSNYSTVSYLETDIKVFAHYYTDDFNSEIMLLAIRKVGILDHSFDFVKNKELLSEIYKKTSGHLVGRIYKQDTFDIVLDSINKDISEILLPEHYAPITLYNIYVNKLPIKGIYFYYKFFNLELQPLFFKYHNDTFICRVFLFLITY